MDAAQAMAASQGGLAAALAASMQKPEAREPDYISSSFGRINDVNGTRDNPLASKLDPISTMPAFTDIVGSFPPDINQLVDSNFGRLQPVNPDLQAALDKTADSKRPGTMPAFSELASTFPPAAKSTAAGGSPYSGIFADARFAAAGGAPGKNPYDQLMENAEALTQPTPRPSRERPVDPRIVQTILGEAANQGALGQAGVAQSIMNRSQKNPDSIIDPVDVVMKDYAYSTWNSPGQGGNNPTKYQPGDPAYEQAEQIFRDVRDNAYDFTGGATHYYNPDIVSPNWADPKVAGTERKYDAIDIEDHRYLPRVAPEDRPFMNANPALAGSIAAGGIGPNAPVPQQRPTGIASAMALNDPGPSFSASDMVRRAQSPTNQLDRLPANYGEDPFFAGGIDAAAMGGRTVNQIGPLYDPVAKTYVAAAPQAVAAAKPSGTMGGPNGPIPASYVEEDVPLPRPRPERKQDESLWSKTISAAGDALDNTLMGGALKAIFPEFWEGAGEVLKGNGKGGTLSMNDVDWDSISGGQSGGGGGDGGGGAFTGLEATTPAGGTDPATGKPYDLATLFKIWYPEVVWPGAGYDPGVSNEHDYFPRFAEGGPVLAPQRMSEMPPTADLDPRLITIMNAEDALRGQHPKPEEALQAFLETFGKAALEKLMERVQGQAAPAAEDGPRMISGPGGPKDDMVPAIIDGNQPAKLSSGEFVMPAEAVAGAGEGDPAAGAEKLTQLADMLGQRA